MKVRYMNLKELEQEILDMWIEVSQIENILQTDRHIHLFDYLINLMYSYEGFQQDLDNFNFDYISEMTH